MSATRTTPQPFATNRVIGGSHVQPGRTRLTILCASPRSRMSSTGTWKAVQPDVKPRLDAPKKKRNGNRGARAHQSEKTDQQMMPAIDCQRWIGTSGATAGGANHQF